MCTELKITIHEKKNLKVTIYIILIWSSIKDHFPGQLSYQNNHTQ